MENITISLEEYKELLIIKGKYEELKCQQTIKKDGLLRDTTKWFPEDTSEWTKIICTGE